MGKTTDLTLAKKRKKDEFYTQLVDIENELKHYKEHFKDKVVLCNCDDPRKSNFAFEEMRGDHINWKLIIAVLVLNAVIFGLLYSPIVTI